MSSEEIKLEIDDIAPRLGVFVLDRMKTLSLREIEKIHQLMELQIDEGSKPLNAKAVYKIFAIIGSAYVTALDKARTQRKESADAVANRIDR